MTSFDYLEAMGIDVWVTRPLKVSYSPVNKLVQAIALAAQLNFEIKENTVLFGDKTFNIEEIERLLTNPQEKKIFWGKLM